MAAESKTRNCPFCKEEIKADAIRCKHCRSVLAPEKPTHSGTCPYCKEAIHPEAIKCKHCGSSVGPKQGCEGCGPSQTEAGFMALRQPTGVGGLGRTGGLDHTTMDCHRWYRRCMHECSVGYGVAFYDLMTACWDRCWEEWRGCMNRSSDGRFPPY
jgi:hypothetical protein